MAEPNAKIIRRSEYRPPPWIADDIRLEFDLSPDATRVKSTILFRPNPAEKEKCDLRLDGESLKLVSASIDGQDLAAEDMRQAPGGLTVPGDMIPDGEFQWRSDVEISPQENTALEGLYMSKGMYCTQCEPEGFRRICYFPDRPDITARFSTLIKSPLPALLSNGNLIAKGDGCAEWQDPWPKPSYLFALVAGDLVAIEDSFRTAGGRQVELRIWIRRGDEEKCDYAMDALKRAMRWDETAYGREYDLDLFNIVAVDDFNMGAMENKGLNIFNSKLVLASPDTATDGDYESIESVIAHEYFHNWTGNRITCRDWFQLSLKEGLTVFRDQQFSSDQRSADVVRIRDAQRLRNAQFREDAGPLAHPVRPETYREINNFYTATVYEKGAEIVAMLWRMFGPAAYRSALDLYFERHDGEACTIEDWIKVFEDTSGRDLTQFKLWYSQAGTPRLSCHSDYSGGTLSLTFRQSTPDTPRQTGKKPFVIPIEVGLLNANGAEMRPSSVLEMTEDTQTFEFSGLPSRPIVSILRGFSAPVILRQERPRDELLFILRRDTDSFNRWDAGQTLVREILHGLVLNTSEPNADFVQSYAEILLDSSLDEAFRALMLEFPPEGDLQRSLSEAGGTADPTAVRNACETLRNAFASQLADRLESRYSALADDAPFAPDARSAGRRSLRNAFLRLLTRLDGGEAAAAQYAAADNMTDRIAALRSLPAREKGAAELRHFHREWSHDRLVLDKWFALQILEAPPARAAALVRELAEHSDFEWRNPNRFRSVVATFAFANHAGFSQC